MLMIESENLLEGTIFESIENNFFMMRQWTLFESMRYSNLMTSKMQLWKQAGIESLKQFMAVLGVPLTQGN